MVQKSANFVLFSKLPPKATMLKKLNNYFFFKGKIRGGGKNRILPTQPQNAPWSWAGVLYYSDNSEEEISCLDRHRLWAE